MEPHQITQRIEAYVLRQVNEAAKEIAIEGEELIVSAAPNKTGKLQESIAGEHQTLRNGARVRFSANTPYAAVQDRGWMYRRIKQGRLRAALNVILGKPNRTRVVFRNHPGGGGPGYMSKTFQNNIRKWQARVAQEIKDGKR